MLKDNSKDNVFFKPDGGKDASSTKMVDRYRMIMLDGNDMPRTDENRKTLYETGPHPNNLPGQRLLCPDEDTNLPPHLIVGECLDNFDAELEKNEVRKMSYKVKYTKDDHEDIMIYNEIVDYMSRDTTETDVEY